MEKANICAKLCGKNNGKSGKDAKDSTESPTCCVSDCMLKAFGFFKYEAFDGDFAVRSIVNMDANKTWSNEVSLKEKNYLNFKSMNHLDYNEDC